MSIIQFRKDKLSDESLFFNNLKTIFNSKIKNDAIFKNSLSNYLIKEEYVSLVVFIYNTLYKDLILYDFTLYKVLCLIVMFLDHDENINIKWSVIMLILYDISSKIKSAYKVKKIVISIDEY